VSPPNPDALCPTPPLAMVLADIGPNSSARAAAGSSPLHSGMSAPLRALLDIVEAQSRQLEDVNQQLDSARAALAERKVIEKAKGLLMKGQRLSEARAYALMRETAMRQNRRLID